MKTEEDYVEMINQKIDEFWKVENVQSFSETDKERIRAAYELAREAHSSQKRKTGEPYIIHPIAVATIVAKDFELGVNPIIAAFLHDVVEDTRYSIDDIKEKFGSDVAFLVGTVTKEKKKTKKFIKK